MNALSEVFPVILCGLLIILVIALIILVIRLIRTLSRVDEVVDDINQKVRKLDRIFSLVDNTTDAISCISDKFANILANSISSVFNKKKKGKDDYE